MDEKELLSKLKDVKGLVEIEDYSIYYFSALVVIVSILVLALLYLLFTFLKHRKKENIRKIALEKLLNIDLSDTKKAAYELTKYGAVFKDDSTRHFEMFKNLLDHLQAYKYKKDVAKTFDEDTLKYISLYKEMCDV